MRAEMQCSGHYRFFCTPAFFPSSIDDEGSVIEQAVSRTPRKRKRETHTGVKNRVERIGLGISRTQHMVIRNETNDKGETDKIERKKKQF